VLSKEQQDAVDSVETSIGQGDTRITEDSFWDTWDDYVSPKHESVLLDYGAKYGYVNSILHLRDKNGTLWQISESGKPGRMRYDFYRFNDEAMTTTAFGPMRYSHFLKVFGDKP
jgi:hypothetical protein